jgi:IclR family acetate operon transcriptional repressor
MVLRNAVARPDRETNVVSFRQAGNVASVAKALGILGAFKLGERSRSLREIAADAGIPQSTAAQLLSTLEEVRLVVCDQEKQTYQLGTGALELAGIYLTQQRVDQTAYPVLRTLSTELGLTANLGVLDGTAVVLVASIEGSQPFSLRSSVGIRNIAHCSSSGKTLLAALPLSQLEKLYPKNTLEKCTTKSIGTRKELHAELDRVRRQGYAIDDEETADGIRCVAVSVSDFTRREIAAVSVSGLTSMLPPKRIETIAKRVRAAADEISWRLGARAQHASKRKAR